MLMFKDAVYCFSSTNGRYILPILILSIFLVSHLTLDLYDLCIDTAEKWQVKTSFTCSCFGCSFFSGGLKINWHCTFSKDFDSPAGF